MFEKFSNIFFLLQAEIKIVEYFNNYDNNILQRSKRGLKKLCLHKSRKESKLLRAIKKLILTIF